MRCNVLEVKKSLLDYGQLLTTLLRYSATIVSMLQGHPIAGGWFSVTTDCSGGVVSIVT